MSNPAGDLDITARDMTLVKISVTTLIADKVTTHLRCEDLMKY